MENIYYGITVVVYGIFIIRFILSWVGADFDVDADLDLNDVVSFKGLTHFLMGASAWLSGRSYFDHQVLWYDYLIAFALGLVFVIILYYVYKFLTKLESKPQIITGKGFVGNPAIVYLHVKDEGSKHYYIITADNGVGTTELPACSNNSYNIGDRVVISDFANAYYII